MNSTSTPSAFQAITNYYSSLKCGDAPAGDTLAAEKSIVAQRFGAEVAKVRELAAEPAGKQLIAVFLLSPEVSLKTRLHNVSPATILALARGQNPSLN